MFASPSSSPPRAGGAGPAALRLREPGPAALVLLLASALALAAALGFQYLGGLAPCPLCVYQRWPYVAVMALAAATPFAPRPRALLALCALVLAGNAALAGYHVGVERGWFALPEGCQVAAGAGARTVEELRAMLVERAPRCDEVAWSLLGLSMAAWNGAVALGLALFAAVAAATPRRGRARAA
ncbi:MAG TPA: disulfide bond formation protein B [Geminicoccaceae bacterium]|nr:disulfide bond formation protein B [Geminicoccaceae bacterium]